MLEKNVLQMRFSFLKSIVTGLLYNENILLRCHYGEKLMYALSIGKNGTIWYIVDIQSVESYL